MFLLSVRKHLGAKEGIWGTSWRKILRSHLGGDLLGGGLEKLWSAVGGEPGCALGALGCLKRSKSIGTIKFLAWQSQHQIEEDPRLHKQHILM